MAQEGKSLQLRQEILSSTYPQEGLVFDEEGTMYYTDASTSFDTCFLCKRDNQGVLQWKQKIATTRGSFNSVNRYDTLVYVSFTFQGTMTIGDSVYHSPLPDPNHNFYGSGLIVYGKSGKMHTHKLLGGGFNFAVNAIQGIDSNSIYTIIEFDSLLNLNRCGGPKLAAQRAIQNTFGWLKLDRNFQYDTLQYSECRCYPGHNWSPDLERKRHFLSGYFSEEDTLEFSNFRAKSSMLACPYLFFLRSDGTVRRAILGEPNAISGNSASGYFRYAGEDEDGNLYSILACYGSSRFAGLDIGKDSLNTHVIMKLDSAGHGLWQKTITTSGLFNFGNGMRYNRHTHKLNLIGAICDSFSLGGLHFSEEDANRRFFSAQMDTSGNVLWIKTGGFQSALEGSVYTAVQGSDSIGNLYTLAWSYSKAAVDVDCYVAEATPSLPSDSMRLFWLKTGAYSLKKDSISVRWPLCTVPDQSSVRAYYHTKNGSLQYHWSTGDTGSVFSPLLGGNYRLVVSDGSCLADTQNISLPFQTVLPQPLILGTDTVLPTSQTQYHLSVPDSVKVHWLVSGGSILSGADSSHVIVSWPGEGLGQLIALVSDSGNICMQSDTLHILITSMNGFTKHIQTTVVPNPASGFVTITTGSSYPVQYSILDITGRACLTGHTDQTSFSVDLQSLPSGMYRLQLNTVEGIWTETILKE
jgi:hypothetical protein